jgi:hypothetical protein
MQNKDSDKESAVNLVHRPFSGRFRIIMGDDNRSCECVSSPEALIE